MGAEAGIEVIPLPWAGSTTPWQSDKVKVMTNLDSIFKSRDVTLWTKVCVVKAMVFPVVLFRYESWTIKKAER